MNIAITILASIVGIYFALMLLLYLRQSKHLYKPTHEIETTPEQLGFEYDSIMFKTSDNITLNGWFIPQQPLSAYGAQRVVLFFHGNTGNISHCMETIELYHRLGLGIFLFDYRGYGNSIGRTTEQGTYHDAEAAWLYLVNTLDIPPEQIIVHGRSLGGAVASWLVSQYTPKAFIIESTFTSAADIAVEHFPHMPARLLTRFHYNVLENIENVECPVLVVCSREDNITPIHHAIKLFDAARDPKEFLEIEGNHYDGFLTTGQRYIDGLEAFINKYTAHEKFAVTG